MINKIVPVWKPTDITSYDVVRKIKSIYDMSKVGHCGTLDPFAKGVIIICTGTYTKKSQNFMDCHKTYTAEINVGHETDTLDHTGDIIKSSNKNILFNEKILHNALLKFKGEIDQIPPYFSAKKVCGVKMYSLARKDIFIRTKPFKVYINSLRLINFTNNTITIEVNCNKGTYIRSLARDICYELGTFGHLSKLERKSVGEYTRENSIDYNNLETCLLKN
tara:strand:- start:394 stop:1053 length:660 start_codon:yes stop_codon:yes gene_type:complete